MKDIIILGIETSCDETSAAVVVNGRRVLSNIIATQVNLHAEYGGVVPELASRKHVEAIIPVIDKACREAGVELKELDAVGVTYGPGLVGALLVGLSAAKAIAFALGKPLIGVNHIDGHICANYIAHEELEPPFICLVASGGHSHIVNVVDYKKTVVLGRTRDDAAGEAFDKIARVLGLGYPGGPKVEKKALEGNPEAFNFPRVKFKDSPYDFSFSGLKTAVINTVHQLEQKNEKIPVEDICASFQKAVVDVLVENTVEAAVNAKSQKVCIAGGVSANTFLRQSLEKACSEAGIELFYPPLGLCTDNAAMIASAAYFSYVEKDFAPECLNAIPGLDLGER
ncbi:tRNA threonylcarbamoyladenosine biosynthesis protein Gcp [Thermoclostridium stercorarium subsp. stercorarium DSM 8532]|uniref:tRNA N6-adenosine threonylcarbamoyltransferase n=3 Tax=Thermoclostridium stercorarium TaxID=1510 RepID=L7VMB4_THES1|nr:tRNA (adenosine(37)-N6)-threonylcarbamoyltransferase complex transferase subunit TsaD [Thermoclostridium stercorarium]AGC69360.1 tRNA threonylcarbamoyladenosine biosynthesis protein Gcp [Thermoclostridium stercorarium subsp. stercorarium DSM 8532]AGI40320.1 O-sialoglycoprotein endopeptidase [Thermoclostridium stercorarium subsp. stercorarium DSM 8532]ANW99617.1 N(6)-L-threonylcarbamoyladenine synthase TsaD [Thermoclostridium stercorarium subsp. thermolacticum DSM 2910]ANX02244.1 N(6)-L-threo